VEALMPEAINPTFKRWCIVMWESLTDGKLWAIPRSETVFQRQGDRLVFIEGTDREYDVVKAHFAEIGVEVVPGRLHYPDEERAVD
jgi:hypothetical protein